MLVLRQDSTQIWRDNKLITEILDSGEIIEYDRKVDNKILSITISKKVKVKINDEKKLIVIHFAKCRWELNSV